MVLPTEVIEQPSCMDSICLYQSKSYLLLFDFSLDYLLTNYCITALVEYDSSLLNSKTGQKFSEILIDSFTTDLLNIAKDVSI